MSRSYRKFAVSKDRNSAYGKRAANKAVRRERDALHGGRFKRLYCSWNICDYRVRQRYYTAEKFRRKWFDSSDGELNWERRRFRCWKDAYRAWKRWNIMK